MSDQRDGRRPPTDNETTIMIVFMLCLTVLAFALIKACSPNV